MTGWTEVRVELLKQWWADGLTQGQIARKLGDVTPAAVGAKVHRLGLPIRTAQVVKLHDRITVTFSTEISKLIRAEMTRSGRTAEEVASEGTKLRCPLNMKR